MRAEQCWQYRRSQWLRCPPGKDLHKWPVRAAIVVCCWHSEVLRKHLQTVLRQEAWPGEGMEMLYFKLRLLQRRPVQVDVSLCSVMLANKAVVGRLIHPERVHMGTILEPCTTTFAAQIRLSRPATCALNGPCFCDPN